jgi:hypothetical protein
MHIIWAGLTIGRLQFKKIDWRCDCGQKNISTGPEWNRTLRCCQCSRRYEVEFNPLQDAIAP